jgi:hypothetical protein
MGWWHCTFEAMGRNVGAAHQSWWGAMGFSMLISGSCWVDGIAAFRGFMVFESFAFSCMVKDHGMHLNVVRKGE